MDEGSRKAAARIIPRLPMAPVRLLNARLSGRGFLQIA
jgi:hypothetical protein